MLFSALNKWHDFSGRASRKEFWHFTLLIWAVQISAWAVDHAAEWNFTKYGTGPFGYIMALPLILPWYAVLVRRMHDVNKPGWPTLLYFAIQIILSFRLYAKNLFHYTVLIPLWLRVIVSVAYFLMTIWLFVLQIKRGFTGPNRYGPDPTQSNLAKVVA